MANERFSKTVRIDLTPDLPAAAGTAAGRNELLAKANWSTRRQQVAAAAATTHSHYEKLLESVYDAAVISAPSGRIIEVNGRAEEFLGYSREQLCNMNIIELIDGGDDSLMQRISTTLLDERFEKHHNAALNSSPVSLKSLPLHGWPDRFPSSFLRSIAVFTLKVFLSRSRDF